jgi:hypothetical protein
LNSRLRACKAGALLLESLSVHFVLVILEIDLKKYLPGLASNLDPPTLSLPSS